MTDADATMIAAVYEQARYRYALRHSHKAYAALKTATRYKLMAEMKQRQESAVQG